MKWFGNSRVGLLEPCALSLKCRLEWLLGRLRPAAKGGGFNPSTQQLHEIVVLAFR